jgi:chorismate synthase
MSSTFGRFFRVTTFGESHGKACGVVVDGVPPCFSLLESDIQKELDRRKPGQSTLVSPRKETDHVQILSGVEDGLTLGTPLALLVYNEDARPQDYHFGEQIFRPSHGDYTYQKKYNIRAQSGGGRASARETLARVAAGAIAQKFLKERNAVEIVAWVQSIHELTSPLPQENTWFSREEIDASLVRCPYPYLSQKMEALIQEVRSAGDSVGGTIQALVRGLPAGWGEPVFDKLEALLGQALLSIPACKGVEFGSGFAGTLLKGSQHNDPFYLDPHTLQVKTRTNHSGGIQAGISNGQPLTLRAAFKPTATIRHPQETLNEQLESVILQGRGRHDPCVLPRAVPIVESMIALVLMDAYLIQEARQATFKKREKNEG